MIAYFVIGGIALTAISVSAYSNAKKKKRLEEEARQRRMEYLLKCEKLKKSLQKKLTEIKQFNLDFDTFRNKRKYLSNYDAFNFKSNYTALFNKLKITDYKDLPDFQEEIRLIDTFISEYSNFDDLLKVRNNIFVTNELVKVDDLLSDVEGKSLDTQQRNAVIVNEDNNLIIAGAGSGKTLTIAGKVQYLTKRLRVNPKEILLISFTRKSADEMAERIQKKMDISLPVKTFHKLGLDIIAESTNEKPSIFGLSQKEILQLISSFISDAKSNDSYFNNLIDFLAYYLKPYKDIHDFKSDAEHQNYLKEQKLEGYKIVEKQTKDGVDIKYRERFKSQEEVLIANFLFRNNIEYKYEESYQYKTASKKFGQYKPDFYLPEYNIYIEHFGIDENNNVPNWFKGKDGMSAKQVYNDGIAWKRNEHQFNGTALVETYSWEQSKGILLSSLKNKLEEKGVDFNPMSDDELWNYIQGNTPEDIDTFTQLLNTFLVLFKSNNESINNLSFRAKQEDNQRATLFLKLFEPILKNYENYLKEHNEIDFSDMINMATTLISNTKFSSPYKYIIIDEFQDISQSRYHLVKALLDQKTNAKLFCVGDDWQSIYRFAGSDIGVFTGFAEYFETSTISGFKRKTNKSYIEHTYRFDNKLIELSSNFILKNPNQIEKSLKSNKQSKLNPLSIHKYNDAERNGNEVYKALNEALDEINKKEKDNNVSILLLGRYDFEKRIIDNSKLISKQYNKQFNRYDYIYKENHNHQINFLTVHTSKGLEADYIIILNGNSGTYGFPSEISDDPLLNFLLSKADQFPNGEERRLFYVAMTRAKKHVHILSSYEYPSKFVTEIEANEPITTLKCGWCDNGKLIERKGPYGYFYACNNHHYCNYTKKINAEDLSKVADELTDKKDFESAIKYYSKSLEIENDNAKVQYNLARAYEQNNQLSEAIKYYSKSLESDGSNIYAFYWRGSAYYDINYYEKAFNDWLKFDEFKPGSNNVYFWMAKAKYQQEQYDAAIKYLNKNLELNKDDNDSIELKKKCLDKFKEALQKKETHLNSNGLGDIKNLIQLGIAYNLNLKFNYHKSIQFDGGIQSLRTIRPSEFKTVGNSLCVEGYCYMREENRTFNIERMSKLVLNPNRIEYWSKE
ncbi:UvrD-helicase domain-containing protein [Pontimicrobium aquaticum]|uniref:DNA 3'-5' helicase n=1 Tax=Pontimicrobium aquaticum TaxID=2565367 RepID=A0A4U0EVD8_9FLAO|nr:UvrD-helicase domain-containing protein [Pontimicrobium aquaticum]TJY35887.1 tetratricopeptide repeat protein [Pontimicrobium aquaticum]